MQESVSCPCCGWRLMDRNRNIQVEVEQVKPHKTPINMDFNIKCRRCKNKVAIKKIS